MTGDVQVAEAPRTCAAVVRGHTSHDGIPDFLGKAFGSVMRTVGEQGLQVTGPPFARYVLIGTGWDIEAGFPVDREPDATDEVKPETLPGGTVARLLYTGPYSGIGAAYESVVAWLGEQGYEQTEPAWESYLSEPDVEEPVTELFVPCQRRSAG